MARRPATGSGWRTRPSSPESNAACCVLVRRRSTPAAIDAHVHFLTPAQVPHALSNGVTTLIGGGTGPADGSKGTTCTPGPWNIARMLEASAVLPVNVGQLHAGACGFKVHED